MTTAVLSTLERTSLEPTLFVRFTGVLALIGKSQSGQKQFGVSAEVFARDGNIPGKSSLCFQNIFAIWSHLESHTLFYFCHSIIIRYI